VSPAYPRRVTSTVRTTGFSLFATPIGRCAIAWSDRGVAGLQLPEGPAAATRARMRRRFPEAREQAPPRAVGKVIRDVTAVLRGELRDLTQIALDMDEVAPFPRRVYEAARAIPAGATATYGAIAERLGDRGLARAVGQALGRNPFPIVVPCHRVLAASGRSGGFSARGGVATKLRMLAIEGVDPAASRRALAPGFDPVVAVRHLRDADPVLARVVDRVGACRLELKSADSLFSALAEAIVHQQLSGRAAATIHGRLRSLYPRARVCPTPLQILRTSDERLRGVGLSAAKVRSLRDLATRARAREIPTLDEARGMDDEALIERLTAVHGIGRWTVEMFLIFHLGRPDVLAVDDYGLRKGFAVAARKRVLPTPKELAARGARWAPYRTLASWYLWRAAEGSIS